MPPTPQPSIEKGQYVSVTPEHLCRLSASDQRHLSLRKDPSGVETETER